MKIGVNTWVWTSPFTTKEFDLIPKVKQMGFDILEVALDDAALIDAKLLRKMTEDNGLSVTVCGAFGPTRDISSDDPAIRKNGVDYISESVRFAEAVGSTLFSGPVYSAVGKTRMVPEEQKKQEWAWCVENLRALGKVASDAGVTIGVEPLNRFETDMINLVEQALALVDDVGIPPTRSTSTRSMPTSKRRASRTRSAWSAGRLGHFHACENDRGIPGTGHQDWNGMRDALREVEYDGAVVIESFTPGAVEIAKAASIWRPLAPSQDELASQGARFLRALLG